MFGRTGFNFHWMVGVSVAQQAPQIRDVVSHRAHPLPLRPMRLLVADQAPAVQVLGQDEDPPRG